MILTTITASQKILIILQYPTPFSILSAPPHCLVIVHLHLEIDSQEPEEWRAGLAVVGKRLAVLEEERVDTRI